MRKCSPSRLCVAISNLRIISVFLAKEYSGANDRAYGN